jgi:transposase
MKEISVLGIDLAKNIFQLHGVSSDGHAILKKRLNRKQLIIFVSNLPKCVIAMEACGGSHYWARKFTEMGHEVRLISPQFVKPFVKSNKNDANDAEAIVEAVLRPSMRFVAVKTIAQQESLCVHRVCERLIGSRTALINEIRGLLNEFGILIPQGASHVRRLLPEIIELNESQLSQRARELFSNLYAELCSLDERIEVYDKKIKAEARSSELCQKVMQIPGVGPKTATAIVSSVGDANLFENGRQLSAWLGLVPRQKSSGGKSQLLGISKRGDSYVRKLLIHGARSVLRTLEASASEDPRTKWLKELLARRGYNRACVALANKNARVIWKLMTTDEVYRAA